MKAIRKRSLGLLASVAWMLVASGSVSAFEMSSGNFALQGGALNASGKTDLQNPGIGTTQSASVTVGQLAGLDTMTGGTTGIKLEPGFQPIALPEPGMVMSLVSGLMFLAVIGRQRARP